MSHKIRIDAKNVPSPDTLLDLFSKKSFEYLKEKEAGWWSSGRLAGWYQKTAETPTITLTAVDNTGLVPHCLNISVQVVSVMLGNSADALCVSFKGTTQIAGIAYKVEGALWYIPEVPQNARKKKRVKDGELCSAVLCPREGALLLSEST